ncbi:MAG: hypothetical protein LBF34_01250 [Puniceicoccales bacterium]|nr:hypothetical protein [Puniceicoccales bacterium]
MGPIIPKIGIRPKEFRSLRSVIGAIQRTPVILEIFNNNGVVYNGRSINFKDASLVGQCVSNALEGMALCYRVGGIYSDDGSTFTRKFAEHLVFFLPCFSFWLHNPGSVAIAASEVKSGLKWSITLMKATECYSRRREICVENVIRKL